jgi:hypothetical protein
MTTYNELARVARLWAAQGGRTKWNTLPSLRLWDAVQQLPEYPVTLRRYVVPNEPDNRFSGWGIFLIDSSGMLACVTDYGNYAYKWSSIGPRDFRAFLCGCDAGYLIGKLDPSKHYDGDATGKQIRRTILEDRRADGLSCDQARDEWDLICDSDLDSEMGFGDWIRRTSYSDAYDFAVYTSSASVQMFCERLWPRLVAQLKQQLEKEKPDA